MKSFQPLKRTRVLDLSRLIPGPFCTKILSDLGAEVVKIEDNKRGDYIHIFPPYVFDQESVLAVGFHKNKKRLKLNLRDPEGIRIIHRLVQKADVFIESYRPGVTKKMCLDPKTIHQINPKIVYISLRGYKDKTKRACQAGHDINYMAVSTMLQHMTTSKCPQVPAYQIGDFVGGGLMGAMMILAALIRREKNDQPCYIELSIVDALVYLNEHFLMDERLNLSMISGKLARYNIYESKDGVSFALGALEDKFWRPFCDLIQRPDFIKVGLDEVKNKKVIRELKKIFLLQTSRHWKKMGLDHDICLTPIGTKAELLEDGYLKTVSIKHPKGRKRLVGSGLLQHGSMQEYHAAGTHNASFLKKNGFSASEIRAFKEKGVLT